MAAIVAAAHLERGLSTTAISKVENFPSLAASLLRDRVHGDRYRPVPGRGRARR